ncbi:unnamed protein product [Leuciscus chuanchicus]
MAEDVSAELLDQGRGYDWEEHWGDGSHQTERSHTVCSIEKKLVAKQLGDELNQKWKTVLMDCCWLSRVAVLNRVYELWREVAEFLLSEKHQLADHYAVVKQAQGGNYRNVPITTPRAAVIWQLVGHHFSTDTIPPGAPTGIFQRLFP